MLARLFVCLLFAVLVAQLCAANDMIYGEVKVEDSFVEYVDESLNVMQDSYVMLGNGGHLVLRRVTVTGYELIIQNSGCTDCSVTIEDCTMQVALTMNVAGNSVVVSGTELQESTTILWHEEAPQARFEGNIFKKIAIFSSSATHLQSQVVVKGNKFQSESYPTFQSIHTVVVHDNEYLGSSTSSVLYMSITNSASIEGNYVSEPTSANSRAIEITGSAVEVVIQHNKFNKISTANSYSLLYVDVECGSTLHIENNTFLENNADVMFEFILPQSNCVDALFTRNVVQEIQSPITTLFQFEQAYDMKVEDNIFELTSVLVSTGTSFEIHHMPNNYWGSSDQDAIRNAMNDVYSKSDSALVNFSPFKINPYELQGTGIEFTPSGLVETTSAISKAYIIPEGETVVLHDSSLRVDLSGFIVVFGTLILRNVQVVSDRPSKSVYFKGNSTEYSKIESSQLDSFHIRVTSQQGLEIRNSTFVHSSIEGSAHLYSSDMKSCGGYCIDGESVYLDDVGMELCITCVIFTNSFAGINTTLTGTKAVVSTSLSDGYFFAENTQFRGALQVIGSFDTFYLIGGALHVDTKFTFGNLKANSHVRIVGVYVYRPLIVQVSNCQQDAEVMIKDISVDLAASIKIISAASTETSTCRTLVTDNLFWSSVEINAVYASMIFTNNTFCSGVRVESTYGKQLDIDMSGNDWVVDNPLSQDDLNLQLIATEVTIEYILKANRFTVAWPSTWSKYYYFDRSIDVKANLTLAAGAQIQFDNEAEMIVDASLFAEGTSTKRITIDGRGILKRLVFSGKISSTSHLNFVTITGAKELAVETPGVTLMGVVVSGVNTVKLYCSTIEHSTFNTEVLIESESEDSCSLKNNAFHDALIITAKALSFEMKYNTLIFTLSIDLTSVERSEIVENQITQIGPATSQIAIEQHIGSVVIQNNTVSNSGTKFIAKGEAPFLIEGNKIVVSNGIIAEFVVENCKSQMTVQGNEFSSGLIAGTTLIKFSSQNCDNLSYFYRNTIEVPTGSFTSNLFDIKQNGVVIRRNIINTADIAGFFTESSADVTIDARENYWGTNEHSRIQSSLSIYSQTIYYLPYLVEASFSSELYYGEQDFSEGSSTYITSQESSNQITDSSTESTSAEKTIEENLQSTEGDALVSFVSDLEASSDFAALSSLGVERSEKLENSFVSLSIESLTSSPMLLESESDLSTSTEKPTISATLTTNNDICHTLQLKALVSIDSGDHVDDAQYSWLISGAQGNAHISVTNYAPIVEIAVGSLPHGMYRISVSITGTVRGFSVEAEAYTLLNKAEGRFGKDCSVAVVVESSYDKMTPVVSRFDKIVLSPSFTGASDLAIRWNVSATSSSSRAIIDIGKYVVTSFDAPAIALYSESGLPGDASISIRLNIYTSNALAYVSEYKVRTTPKYTISDGSYTVVPNSKAVSGFDGFALKTVFTFVAIGWVSTPAANLKYKFAYLDPVINKNITLAYSTNQVIQATLPPGRISDFKLETYVTVQTEWGDSVTVSKTLKVAPEDVALIVLQGISQSALSQNDTQFVVDSISLASYLSLKAGKVGKTYREAYSLMNDLLFERVEKLIIGGVTIANETDIQQQIALVGLLTKSNALASDETKHAAVSLMESVLERYGDSRVLPVETSSLIAEVISNAVAGDLKQNSTLADSVTSVANKLASSILSQRIVSEEAVTLKSDNFALNVKVDTAASLNGIKIQTSTVESTIVLPNSFSVETNVDSSSVIHYVLLTYKNSPFHKQNNTKLESVPGEPASPVVDLTFYDNKSSNKVNVSNLISPISIEISKPNRCDLVGDYSQFECKYWNEQELVWSTDGCVWEKESTTDTSVMCKCNHTTSFSAFILHKGKCPKKAPGMSITGILFNTLYLVTCSSIMIGMFIMRDKQPLKSRFIAPYIGISAIIVDAVLQGIINNSLSLAEEWRAVDAFSYVVIMVANPLSVTALFIYLWQQVRFILLQNIYYLMRRKKYTPLIVFCRIIASKALFVTSSVIVGVVTLLYFMSLVAVSATRTNSIQTDRIIAIQSTSYAGIIMFLTVSIVAALVVDLTVSMRRITSEKTQKNTEDSEEMQYEQMRGVGTLLKHISNDPLMFRVEAVTILVALLFMLLLYPIGITTVFKNSAAKSSLSISRFAIEILYMISSIVAFGGFVCAYTLYTNRYNLLERSKQMKEDIKKDASVEFSSTLKDAEGLRLFSNYCESEFSLENILLYSELEELRSLNLVMSAEERKQTLQRIHSMYIANNSERQLNCDNKVRKHFETIYQKDAPTANETEEVYFKLFNAALVNLGDTFTRFSQTKEYTNYMKAKELHRELEDSI